MLVHPLVRAPETRLTHYLVARPGATVDGAKYVTRSPRQLNIQQRWPDTTTHVPAIPCPSSPTTQKGHNRYTCTCRVSQISNFPRCINTNVYFFLCPFPVLYFSGRHFSLQNFKMYIFCSITFYLSFFIVFRWNRYVNRHALCLVQAILISIHNNEVKNNDAVNMKKYLFASIMETKTTHPHKKGITSRKKV